MPDSAQLFRRLRDAASETDRRRLRDEIVRAHLPLAHHLAGRFGHRGIASQDLDQVAALALVKAVDRFDVDRGAAFATFATPTILGELKRHFRDHAWPVHIPRGLQERALSITAALDRLTQQLQRSPTVADLAAELGCSTEDVLAGLECVGCYVPVSLDRPREDGRDFVPGGEDNPFAAVEDEVSLRPLLAALPSDDRELLRLRFVDELAQWQIAERIGVSQMQVSRLLTRCLNQLRRRLAPSV